jgi:hypothetical protein
MRPRTALAAIACAAAVAVAGTAGEQLYETVVDELGLADCGTADG